MIPLSTFFPPPPPPGRLGDPGILGPGSTAWLIGRERLLLASGPAALLLQVAHPLVAEGVAVHSTFTADPLRRLRGTLDAVLTVTFGDGDQVRAAAWRVGRRHRLVTGTLPVATGSLAAGTPYRAQDPDLALWVFATLVWTSVVVTDGFVGPMPPAERDAYYRDMTQVARRFGVPASVLPADWSALDRYVADRVRHDLTVGPTATLLAGQVLAPDPPLLAGPARRLPALLAAGVLPPAVRDAYGLPWRHRERVAFHSARHVTRRLLPLLPERVRYWPHYLVATARLRTSARPTAAGTADAGSPSRPGRAPGARG